MSTTSTDNGEAKPFPELPNPFEQPESPGAVDDMCPNCVTPWKCNGPHIDNDADRGVEEHSSPFPLYLSPSQVSGLLMCGEQFRLTRLVKVPERPMWAGIGGSTVHKVTEILDRRKWAGDHD